MPAQEYSVWNTYNDNHVCHVLFVREKAVVEDRCTWETRCGSIYERSPGACKGSTGIRESMTKHQVRMDILNCVLKDNANNSLLGRNAYFGSTSTKNDVGVSRPLRLYSCRDVVSDTATSIRCINSVLQCAAAETATAGERSRAARSMRSAVCLPRCTLYKITSAIDRRLA